MLAKINKSIFLGVLSILLPLGMVEAKDEGPIDPNPPSISELSLSLNTFVSGLGPPIGSAPWVEARLTQSSLTPTMFNLQLKADGLAAGQSIAAWGFNYLGDPRALSFQPLSPTTVIIHRPQELSPGSGLYNISFLFDPNTFNGEARMNFTVSGGGPISIQDFLGLSNGPGGSYNSMALINVEGGSSLIATTPQVAVAVPELTTYLSLATLLAVVMVAGTRRRATTLG